MRGSICRIRLQCCCYSETAGYNNKYINIFESFRVCPYTSLHIRPVTTTTTTDIRYDIVEKSRNLPYKRTTVHYITYFSHDLHRTM